MKKLLIIPLLLVVVAVRIIFHIAAGLVFLPYSLLKRIADGAGAILKELIKGERSHVKAKQQTQSVIGQVSPGVGQDELPTA